MKQRLEITREINGAVRKYNTLLYKHGSRTADIVASFRSLDEAIYYATYELGYFTDEIHLNF